MKNENLFVEHDEGYRTVFLQQFINSKILATVNYIEHRGGNMSEELKRIYKYVDGHKLVRTHQENPSEKKINDTKLFLISSKNVKQFPRIEKKRLSVENIQANLEAIDDIPEKYKGFRYRTMSLSERALRYKKKKPSLINSFSKGIGYLFTGIGYLFITYITFVVISGVIL